MPTNKISADLSGTAFVVNVSRSEKVMLSKQAIKSFIPIELIANAVAFLAADEATTITGTAIPVEGGWTAQ